MLWRVFFAMCNQYNPDYVGHPGKFLKEMLESREIEKQEFTKKCDTSVKQSVRY